MKKMASIFSSNPMVKLAKVGRLNGDINQSVSSCMMKSALLGMGLLAALLYASSTQAALLTYDGFNYTPTGPFTINDQGGGTGWDANWGQFLGGATGYIVTNGSLADPSATLFTNSNRVYSTGGFAGRYFTQPSTIYGTPGSTNYFSILIRPESAPATNHYYGLQLFSNVNDTGDGHDLFVGKNGSSLFYGLEYSTLDAGTNVYVHTYSTTQATLNQTVFLVVRVIFADPTGPDSFSLYVNPTPGASEPVTADATLSVDIGAQNGAGLNSGNGAHVSFDEIRMGTTFASVTSTLSSPADLLTYEPFAYNQSTVTATLDGQPNNGTQASNGWDNVTWGQYLGGASSYPIASGSLSDPTGKLLTSGNRTQTTTTPTNNSYAGRYNVYTGLPGHTNATPTYYSFLVRPDNLGGTNGYIGFTLYTGNGNGDVLAGVFQGVSPNYGLQHGSTNASSVVPAVSNQTAFLVIRVDYANPGVDTFRLYVNPTPGAPEPVTADATLTPSYDIGNQNGIAFNVGNGAAVSFDEIRVGTNYTDVTPAVASDFRILSITNTGSNIVLTWITTGGKVDTVQATGGSNGSFATNGFVDISPPILIPGNGSVTTNYVDSFGATNQPARYYRIHHP